MKYIRTKDGRIADLQKFVNEAKNTPYYNDFKFEEITERGVIKWTAVGTECNDFPEQVGKRCHFSASLDSDVVRQADTIEELCDEFVVVAVDKDKPFLYELNEPVNSPIFDNEEENIYGAIWTEQGLIFIAKMNKKGKFELLDNSCNSTENGGD